MAPPTLEPAYSEGPKIRVKFPTAPSGARFIRICFESASCTHHVDAVTCKLVDESAQAFPVADGSCTVEVFSYLRYVAKAQFATSEGWGPWSSASNAISLHLLVPAAPAAPVLEAGSKSLRVLWTLPPQPKNTSAYTHVTVWIKCGNGQWKVADATTGTLDVQGAKTSFKASLLQCTVTGLEEGKEYKAKLSVLNDAGWGKESPESKPLHLGWLPPAPAAPVLEAVSSTSLRVLWTLPPQPKNTPVYTNVAVFMRCGNGQWKVADATTGTLDVQGAKTFFRASLLQSTVTGLEEGKHYQATLSVLNDAGWGDSSPDSELLQLPTSEVQLVGSTSREEKDEAGRKRAIDIDDPAKGGDGGGTSRQRQKTAARVKRE